MHNRNNAVIGDRKRHRIDALFHGELDFLAFDETGAVGDIGGPVDDRFNAIAGSTGLLFPGSEVESWEISEGSLRFTIHPDTRQPGRIMVRVPMNADGCMVNGSYIKAEEKVEINLLLISRS